MYVCPSSTYRTIEIHGFKWPHRPTTIALASVLDEDPFGVWLGITQGDRWWAADGSHAGVFTYSFVKLVPRNTFWSACFHPIKYAVDIDIILPVYWRGHILEEVDLELDIVRSFDGNVWIRDQDTFARLRTEGNMPYDIAAEAEHTCYQMRSMVEEACEPFGSVGFSWLAQFLKTTIQSNDSIPHEMIGI